MSLVVEDGGGVPGAESYFSIAMADAYWAARPQDALAAKWAGATLERREGAAREATAYEDATWGTLYIGARKSTIQGLLWPRVDRSADGDAPLMGSDGLPVPGLPPQVVSAAIELGARALAGRLAKDKGEDGWLKVRQVGPIKREWGGPGTPGGSYGFVDGLLAGVLTGARDGVRGNATWFWR